MSKQARALKLKKMKKLKTKRVAGPVTVVALDAALASPSGATCEFSCLLPFSVCFFLSCLASLFREGGRVRPFSRLSALSEEGSKKEGRFSI